MRSAAALALVLALAGCAGPRFVKPGTTAEEAASDYAQCSALAQQGNPRDNAIESDILASRGRDWENSGTLAAHKDVFQADAYYRAANVTRYCMLAKGYTTAP